MRPLPILVLIAAPACGSEAALEEPTDPGPGPAAFCQADVAGRLVEVETDYLPRVISCENGAADFEALRAQAVAARSYLYYALENAGTIGDGIGDQVYTCAHPPEMRHYMAVDETSGEVLRYFDVQVAAFYVAGALQDPPGCTGGADDPTATESYVTYNEGLAGEEIEQTPLGWVDPGNYANRGCMSQNGSHCLSMAGRDYLSILAFYYGADIEVARANGPCVLESLRNESSSDVKWEVPLARRSRASRLVE